MTLLNAFFTTLIISPITTEIFKILFVAVGWPSALAIFMWSREKNKKAAPAQEKNEISEAA